MLIFNKDPDFFRTVVKPYLANKKDKTFIDRWLLGDKLDDYLDPWTFSQLNIVERILLGQSIKNRKATLARHVKDGFDMLPPNIERFNHLFKTAIKGSALETGDAFGFLNAKKSAVGLKDQAQNEGREMSVSADLASAGKTESAGFAAPGSALRTAKSKPRARKASAAPRAAVRRRSCGNRRTRSPLPHRLRTSRRAARRWLPINTFTARRLDG